MVLVIGNYAPSECDKSRFEEEFLAFFLKTPSEIERLAPSILSKVKGVAFKAHSPQRFAEKQINLLPNLKIIANFGVGFDAIDVAKAKEHGIIVTNTPDVLNDDVADLAVGLMIGVSREFLKGCDWVESAKWRKLGEMPVNTKVSGSKCGILGLGRIGLEVGHRLAAFKCDIHYFSREKKEAPIGWVFQPDPLELAKNVDNLFVCLVGGKETENFVSKTMIDAVGPEGIIINISRGSTIDEGALIEALQSGRLKGAGLDVFQEEPNVDERFLKMNNVLLQPHQGSATVSTRRAMANLQFSNLGNFFSTGSCLTPID